MTKQISDLDLRETTKKRLEEIKLLSEQQALYEEAEKKLWLKEKEAYLRHERAKAMQNSINQAPNSPYWSNTVVNSGGVTSGGAQTGRWSSPFQNDKDRFRDKRDTLTACISDIRSTVSVIKIMNTEGWHQHEKWIKLDASTFSKVSDELGTTGDEIIIGTVRIYKKA